MTFVTRSKLFFFLRWCRCRAYFAVLYVRALGWKTPRALKMFLSTTSRLPRWLLQGPPFIAGPCLAWEMLSEVGGTWSRRLAGAVRRVRRVNSVDLFYR